MAKNEWGVTLGVKRIPAPEFVTKGNVYGWKIEKHGIVVYGDTAEKARQEFAKAYAAETGQKIAYVPLKSSPKSNPIKSTRISGRKGLSQTAYVNRPSQDPEHKAPSKRLKTRRKKALKAPEGYFPNPAPKYRGKYPLNIASVASRGRDTAAITLNNGDTFLLRAADNNFEYPTPGKAMNSAVLSVYAASKHAPRKSNPLKPGIEKSGKGGYRVEYSGKDQGPWKLAGAFPTVGAARDYAKALAAKNPKVWFRVAD